jgi:hypothetical protein
MLKPEELEGALVEPNLPVYIDVAQPPSQDRSLADVWSALGGELKPSLDVVVTAPMIVGRTAPYGPPVLIGPTIGLAALGGPDEVVNGKGKPKRTNRPLEAVPEEIVPAKAKDDDPGLRLRVRGLRTG